MKQRAARGKRIKEAESIPQDISLRSKTRTDSNISPAGTFAANRDVQIDRKRVASSGIATTPVKPGNLKISGDSTTRKDVSDGFVHELLDRRWASADLVDHSFDNVVSISLAAKLTLCFLHHQILSVTNTSRNQEVKRKDWPAACLHAASLARLASKAGKVTQEMKERYTWSWSKHLSTGTERAQGNVTGSGGQNNEEGLIDSLSFTPEGHDELLDDVTNGKYNAKEDDEDMNISSEAEDSSDDLLLQLKEILENLKTDSSHRVLSSSVSADVEDYEGKQTDMRSATVQATVYIRQQRRTQPWLRFCLGFMATKDKMGLLRADATGVEECIIPKNIGRGVIESIRLSLGILLATDQELEQHPSFYLRLVTKSTAEPTTVAADNTRPAVDDHNDRSPKKMRSQTSGSVPSMAIPSTPTKSPDPPQCLTFREVNWIILHEGKLHGQHLSNRAPTIFYVKHLIEDRGSLVGRCTRVWCVYQEVLNSDPILDRYRNVLPAGSCVMKGPYALKAYNADMFSEAYEQDILVKSMDLHRLKPFDGVLLPTQYDGCVTIPHLGLIFLMQCLAFR
ncbi:hypothetical protein C0993_007202 [Termitomyces sp. T159_Od127]|nr:hypothetical protein C0993_007202 [Termitomyces sp. T159_Od127]